MQSFENQGSSPDTAIAWTLSESFHLLLILHIFALITLLVQVQLLKSRPRQSIT